MSGEHHKQAMICCCSSLFQRGYTVSTGGNVSVRIDDGMLVDATGTSFARLTPVDFSRCNLDGEPRPGEPRPSKEAPFHAAIYRRRPDVHAVLHLHAPHATALSCLVAPTDDGNALPVVTPDAIIRVGRVPLVEFIPPGSARLAGRVADVCPQVNAILLQSHGVITMGPDLEVAVDVAEELEQTARIWLMSGGAARLLTDEEMASCRPLRGKTVAPGGQRPVLLPGVRLGW